MYLYQVWLKHNVLENRHNNYSSFYDDLETHQLCEYCIPWNTSLDCTAFKKFLKLYNFIISMREIFVNIIHFFI